MASSLNLTKNELHSLARLFSPTVIRELGTTGESGLVGRILSRDLLPVMDGKTTRLDQFFDLAFRQLSRTGSRPEYVFTTALVQKILLGRHNLNSATAVRELRVGNSRADLVLFNGTSTAYEIKSDWDSLSRLRGQIADYLKVFEYVNVFTSESRCSAIVAEMPPEVGVLCLTDRFSITTVKQASANESNLDAATIFESLRSDEVRLLLEQYDHQIPDVPNTRLRSAMRNQFLDLSGAEAHRGMLNVIKITRNLRRVSDLIDQLPASMRSAVIAAPLSKMERDRLLQAMCTPVDVALAWR